MVEMWHRDDVPGAGSQRTRLESAEVVDKVGDDHFHDFVREREGRSACSKSSGGFVTEEAINLDHASTPNGHHAGREAYPYGRGQSQAHALEGGHT